jgi:hypothetical protein
MLHYSWKYFANANAAAPDFFQIKIQIFTPNINLEPDHIHSAHEFVFLKQPLLFKRNKVHKSFKGCLMVTAVQIYKKTTK